MKRKKKKRLNHQYTPLGMRITALCGKQKEIVKMLGVSQQTVSQKLLGENAITIRDIEKLAKGAKVDIHMFFWRLHKKSGAPGKTLLALDEVDDRNEQVLNECVEMLVALEQERLDMAHGLLKTINY